MAFKSSWFFGTLAATSALGLFGYAAYFDYRRRNDPEFRRQLSTNNLILHSNRVYGSL
jgi:hypothetical protein